MLVCLHQLFPPKVNVLSIDNRGNCNDCELNEQNKNCKGYVGVKTIIIERARNGEVHLSETQ